MAVGAPPRSIERTGALAKEKVTAHHGIVGVSFEKDRFFSKSTIRKYLIWGSSEFDRISFLIGDLIHAHNIAAVRNVPFKQAEKTVRLASENIQARIAKTYRSLGMEPEIVSWYDLLCVPQYQRIFEFISARCRDDVAFARSLEAEISDNKPELGRLIGSWDSGDLDLAEVLRIKRLATNYLVHEITGLIVIAEVLGYETLIYPGQDLQIVQRVYADEFFPMSALTKGEPRRRFVSHTPAAC